MPPLDSTAEACPSGRRGTPGERVGGQPPRGFESRGLRPIRAVTVRGPGRGANDAGHLRRLSVDPISGPGKNRRSVRRPVRRQPEREGSPSMKRAAGTVTIAILLALRTPGDHRRSEPGLDRDTPGRGDAHGRGRSWTPWSARAIATSDETYAYASQASGTFSGRHRDHRVRERRAADVGRRRQRASGPTSPTALGTDQRGVPGDPDLNVLAGGATTRGRRRSCRSRSSRPIRRSPSVTCSPPTSTTSSCIRGSTTSSASS